MTQFIPTTELQTPSPPLYVVKNMFSEEIQEMIIKAFSDATLCPVDSVKVSINKIDEKETMALQGTSTQQNGEATTTSLSIENLGKSTYHFVGTVQSPSNTRNLNFNKTIICTSPQTIGQMVKQCFAMSRVFARKQNVVTRMGQQVIRKVF